MVPEGGSRSYLNSNSVIARVTHGSNCFLLTGDAEADTEERMLAEGLSSCNVLKVAHHGGSHSSTAAWLRAVQPSIALISVGEGNTYGHPAKETLERLKAIGADVYRTDTMGAIQVQSDGARVSVPRRPALSIATAPSPAPSVGDRININTASAEMLDELPGIGPSKAEAIIVHRQASGAFSSCEELEQISGIGNKTVTQLLPNCTTR
jgi:comEA protein